jgi:hypothetical protein
MDHTEPQSVIDRTARRKQLLNMRRRERRAVIRSDPSRAYVERQKDAARKRTSREAAKINNKVLPHHDAGETNTHRSAPVPYKLEDPIGASSEKPQSSLAIPDIGETSNATSTNDNESRLDDITWEKGESTLPSRILRTYIVRPRSSSENLELFLKQLFKRSREELITIQKEIRAFKLWFTLKVIYTKPIDENRNHEHGLTTLALPVVFSLHDINNVLEILMEDILKRNANHIRESSGLVIKEIVSGKICISRYQPVGGSQFIKLPDALRNKRCIINVRNVDNRCFAYAVMASLYHNHHFVQNSQHFNSPAIYDQFFLLHPELQQLTYPFEPLHAPEAEELLNINICIYTNNDDEGRSISTLYNSSDFSRPRTVLLFYWTTNADESEHSISHYAAITDLNKFFFKPDDSRSHYLCPKCLGTFRSQNEVSEHLSLCQRPNGNPYIYKFPSPGQNILRFRGLHRMLESPFVVYADCECLTIPIHLVNGKTVRYSKHRVAAIACKVVTRGVQVKDNYVAFNGPNSDIQFLDWLIQFEAETLAYLRDEQRMIISQKQQSEFENAVLCHICHEQFDDENINGDHVRRGMRKVRDHDHLTGLFRGAAHSKCNLQFFNRLKIPVFFHNGKNYDFHILVKRLSRYPDRQIKLIGQSLEKYMLIGWGRHLVFKDSLLFLVGQSLERAVQLLRDATDEPKERRFAQLYNGFQDEFAANPERKELLLRKGVFPYDWFNRWSRMRYKRLPRMGAFHSILRGQKISVPDYRHAHKVSK